MVMRFNVYENKVKLNKLKIKFKFFFICCLEVIFLLYLDWKCGFF